MGSRHFLEFYLFNIFFLLNCITEYWFCAVHNFVTDQNYPNLIKWPTTNITNLREESNLLYEFAHNWINMNIKTDEQTIFRFHCHSVDEYIVVINIDRLSTKSSEIKCSLKKTRFHCFRKWNDTKQVNLYH